MTQKVGQTGGCIVPACRSSLDSSGEVPCSVVRVIRRRSANRLQVIIGTISRTTAKAVTLHLVIEKVRRRLVSSLPPQQETESQCAITYYTPAVARKFATADWFPGVGGRFGIPKMAVGKVSHPCFSKSRKAACAPFLALPKA